MIENGGSLAHLLDENLPPDDMAYFHSMDISGTVYTRMEELGLSKSELAKRMNVSPAQVTKIIKGKENMTLKTIAKLENALDIDMTQGFREPRKRTVQTPDNVVRFPAKAKDSRKDHKLRPAMSVSLVTDKPALEI